jgi:RNA polymerase sigma factor (sigma-70 family)
LEASALQAPAGLSRISLGPLLRLRSDDQLVALFRAGNEDAFALLHDRFQQRLFAYVRQMLGGSRQDAEDVLQDVFVRAYGSLRADDRPINVRAWLYRVAHNRCIDQLRRPTPPASEIFEMSRKPLHDPIEEAQRREDLRRLVEDVGRLPEQQRSALLMREIDGMSYADLADALGTSVPAVKSLLVRARMGLAEAIEARDTDCSVIRVDLTEAYDKGVKASGRARRHMRECSGCTEYRTALRSVRRSFAALSPVGFAPFALIAKALGISGAGGSGVGGGVALSTGAGAASACKVAAVVCTAALATGGAAVEVTKLTAPTPSHAASAGRASAPHANAAAAGLRAPARVVDDRQAARAAAADGLATLRRRAAAEDRAAKVAPLTTDDPALGSGQATAGLPTVPTPAAGEPSGTGGATAPSEQASTAPAGTGGSGDGSGTTPSVPATQDPAAPAGPTGGVDAPGSGGSGGSTSPPAEH